MPDKRESDQRAVKSMEPCESAKRIGRIIHDEMKARLAKDGLKHKGGQKTEDFFAEMVQLAINDSGPARMLTELWEPNLCGHQNMFVYATTGATILNCALCRIAELEEAAAPTEAQTRLSTFQCECGRKLLVEGQVIGKEFLAGAQTTESTPPTDTLKDALTQLLTETIRLAIVRHDLRDAEGEDIGEDEAVNLAQDTAYAMQGEGTCDDTPVKEWTDVMALLAGAAAPTETQLSESTPSTPIGEVSYLADKCKCGHSMMMHDFSSPNPKRRPCGSCDCPYWNPVAGAAHTSGETPPTP